MKKSFIAIFIFLILLVIVIFQQVFLDTPTSPDNFVVQRVIDGDTFLLNNGEKVRLLSIDTPERGEKCYAEASDRLTDLLLWQEVVLQVDSVDRDKYNRLLRWVFLDNKNINLKMVKEGFAKSMIYDGKKYIDDIIQAEQYAKDNNIGCLWK